MLLLRRSTDILLGRLGSITKTVISARRNIQPMMILRDTAVVKAQASQQQQ
jgi:hypothetical protein